MTKTKLFTKSDIGCFADGAFGERHLNVVLGGLMIEIDRDDIAIDLCRADYSTGEFNNEVINDAIEALNENTDEGLVWIMEAGDLILTTEEGI